MGRCCLAGLLLAFAIPGVREPASVTSRNRYERVGPSGGTGR